MIGGKDLSLNLLGIRVTSSSLDIDYQENNFACESICNVPMGIAFDGMGAGLGRGMKNIIPQYLHSEEKTHRFRYEFSHIGFALATGDKPLPYNEELVIYNLQYGNFQAVNCYLLWHGLLQIEKGDFPQVEKIISFSNSICTDYNNDEAKLHSAMLNGRYFLKTGQINKAQEALDDAVSISDLIGLQMLQTWSLGIMLQAESLVNGTDKAEGIMQKVMEKQGELPVLYTFVKTAISIGMLSYYTVKVKNYIAEGKPIPGVELKEMEKIIKTAEKNTGKWVADQTEIYKLIGTLYNQLGNVKKAKTWWEKAIETGTQLGAKLEVDKTKTEMERIASGK